MSNYFKKVFLLLLLFKKEEGNMETKGNCSWRGCCCFCKRGKTSLNVEGQGLVKGRMNGKSRR